MQAEAEAEARSKTFDSDDGEGVATSSELAGYEPYFKNYCVPDQLRDRKQWLLTQNGMFYTHRGDAFEPSSPDQLCSFLVAFDTYRNNQEQYDGLGFYFDPNSSYIGFEVSDSLEENGELTLGASGLVQWMNSYASFSPDGKSMQIIVKATWPPGIWQHSIFKIYNYGPFALSGRKISHAPTEILDAQVQLDDLFERLPWQLISPPINQNGHANRDQQQPKDSSSSSVVHQSSAQESLQTEPQDQQLPATNAPSVDRTNYASPTQDASLSEPVEDASPALSERVEEASSAYLSA